MINKSVYLALSLSLIMMNAFSQQRTPAAACSESKQASFAKTTVANPAEDEYDMEYVKIDLVLNNQSINVRGNVITRARVAVPSMEAYVFELNNQLTIDSVKFDGVLLPVIDTGVVKAVLLPAPLAFNSVFTVQVFYRGQPSVPAGSVAGIRNDQSQTWGSMVTYTLSQPYKARDWWPTKQSLTDKIDSADIWITVRDTLMAGSNGLLKNITPMPGNKLRYEWKTTYPIDYYLLSASVGPYIDYSYKIGFPGTNDSMLYQNYIYNHPQTLSFWQPQIDSVAGMLLYFSELFGRYPFWQEKYGHCMAPVNGGMEHQTMTTQGHFSTTLSVHELAHQWFGDNVTCGSWKDVWLNEGIASYAEYLYVAHFRGAAPARNYMLNVHDQVMQDAGGSVYVEDTTDVSRIFASRLSYHKGSAVTHMLRFVMDSDSLFFQTLKDYQQQFGGGTALTEDLKAVAEQVSGKDLDTFFNQWIYGQGYPLLGATWNQVGNEVYVKLAQTTSVAVSVPLFHTPVELKFIGPQGDTVVRIYNNQSIQTFSFNWDKSIDYVLIDPANWVLNADLGAYRDTTLQSVPPVNELQVTVVPNPATNAWTVSGCPEGSLMALTDIGGRVIWSATASPVTTVPAAGLTGGVYFLRISNNITSVSFKLIKQ